MKKYLREIEVSGLILVIIGIILSWIKGSNYGMWTCSLGLILWHSIGMNTNEKTVKILLF